MRWDAGRFDELSGRGVRVEAVWRDEPQRRAVCFLDDERGADDRAARPEARAARLRSAPLARAVEQVDGVYFTGGDAGRGSGGTAGEGAGGLGPRATRAARGRRRAGRARRERSRQRGALRRRARAPAPVRRSHRRIPRAARSSPAADSHPARYRGPWSTRTAPAMRSPPASRTAWPAGCRSTRRCELASRCGAAVLAGRGPYEGQLTL